MKKIFVLSGPSGAGKSTLIQHLLQNLSSVGLTISSTTRSPRPGEINDRDYHFISKEKFQSMVDNNEFIEYVSCYGNLYGTSKESIDQILATKDICILDLDFKGAYNFLSGKVFIKETVLKQGILILPPSIRTLKKRLLDRKSETHESLRIRLSNSFNVNKIANYQHVIINDNLERSKEAILNIVKNA